MSKETIIAFGMLLTFSNCKAQLTEKDFKLNLDNYTTNGDSSYFTISKKQLLKAKKIITNFNWAVIKNINVYVSNSCTIFGTPSASVNDLSKLKNIFIRISPNSYVIFDVKVINKQNKNVPFKSLIFKVVE